MSNQSIYSRRGGCASKATRYEDTILNITEAAAILRRPVSVVRTQARDGELPVEGWDGDRPYFKAGPVMQIAGVASPTPAARKLRRSIARADGWYWIRRDAESPPACAQWEEGSRSFWLHGEPLTEHEVQAVGPQTLPPPELG